jgi:hypothetical protein
MMVWDNGTKLGVTVAVAVLAGLTSVSLAVLILVLVAPVIDFEGGF